MNQRRNKRNKAKSLYIWHRYTGLFAALFVIFITVSGILLNHTDGLSLKNHHLNVDILLDQYQVQQPTSIRLFSSQGHPISQADDLLFINANKGLAVGGTLVGVAPLNDWLVIALNDRLLIVNSDFQLIETLDADDGVPDNIVKIGTDQTARVMLFSNQQPYHLTTDLSLRQTQQHADIRWSKAEPTSAALTTEIGHRYRANIITLEQFVLDIHSGRFFGNYGTLFFDIVGFILLFLSFTGIIIWFKQRTKQLDDK
jgi:uncharacterized iron-regulated membrane protein